MSTSQPLGPGAGEAVPGPGPRTWVIELPAGLRLLSLNDRLHWAEKGRRTRDLRAAGCVMSRKVKVPPLGRAKVTVEYQPPLVTRRRDLDNVATASGKPLIDGALRDARVLIDDSPEYLTEVTYRIGKPFPKGRVVLFITEVTG